MAGFIDSLDSWLGSDWKQRKTLKKLSRAYECRCGTHVRIVEHRRDESRDDGEFGPLGQGRHHPRSYGTFPRVLGRYARDERVLSLESAVWKMTGLPAKRLGLADRGVVKAGAKADLVVFDPATVADRATFENPHQYATGIGHVVVNGRVVISDGQHTGALPGRLLRPA